MRHSQSTLLWHRKQGKSTKQGWSVCQTSCAVQQAKPPRCRGDHARSGDLPKQTVMAESRGIAARSAQDARIQSDIQWIALFLSDWVFSGFLYLCVGIGFIETTYPECKVCICKKFYRLGFRSLHYQRFDVVIENAFLRKICESFCRTGNPRFGNIGHDDDAGSDSFELMRGD